MGILKIKSRFKALMLALCILSVAACTGKGAGDLQKSSEIVISPGDLLQVSSKEFYSYSDKDFSFYLREVIDGNKLNTILDVTPSADDRKSGGMVHKSIIPKGVSLSGTYVIEVIMDNFPDLKLSSLYIPDTVVEPGIASSLAWEALTSDPGKPFNRYTKEQIVSVYDWIKAYIPGHKTLFGINNEISFVQLYKFLRNGLANNLEFINFLNSLGTSFNYDLQANYVAGPILFGQVKYSPVIDPTLTLPSPGDSSIKENERIILQTYARDLAGDLVFYSWQMKNDSGEWTFFDANTNVVSWTPPYGSSRKTPYEFRVLISNGGPFALWNGSQIPAWNVYVSPNVRAPSITEIDCPTQAFVRTEYKCKLKGTDPTGYKLKWLVYPSSNLFAYTYVNGVRIDDIANPPAIESVNNEIIISLTPLNVDGIQFPTLSHVVKLVNEPGEYPELAATDTKPVRFTVNDNAQAPVFQAMARPYSNWNPYVFGYDLKNDSLSTLPAQSPSFISESFINKSLNEYEFGPLRQWDNICNSDPDSGRADTDPKNSYYFQVKVKSLDDEYAAVGATRDPEGKPTDRIDRFQLMSVVPDGMTQPNLSMEQLLEVDDPDAPGNKIDLLATNYNSDDFTTVFHFRVNLKDFKKSNKNGEKYGVQVCSDHTGPAPSFAPLCGQLGFGLQVESRTPCVKVASNGSALASDESMVPFRKTGSTSPLFVTSMTTPTRLNIQAAGSTGAYQDCTTQDCSMGADLQLEVIPKGVDATDTANHRILKDLPFLNNVTRVTKRESVLTDTNTIFAFSRNSLSDNFTFNLPYPDPWYYTDEFPLGTPLAEFPLEQQRAARQEINASSYSIVPGYVALRSSSGTPERFGILSYYPYPAAIANRSDLTHLPVATENPLPIRNRLVANYSVSLPDTGVSKPISQYFMIPLRGRPTTAVASASGQYSAPYMGNTLCRMAVDGTYALVGTEANYGTNRNNNKRYARLLDYTLYGNFVFNTSIWLTDPVLEVATPVWPCFPGEDLRTTTTVELVKTTSDANNYSGITLSLKEGPDFLGNNSHFTHYPLDLGRKGLMVSYVLFNSASALPTKIPKGTYFYVTKQVQLNPVNFGAGDLPGSGTFQENFLFKTIVDTEIKSGSLTAQVPAVIAWEEMKVPKNVLQWDPVTWQFDFTLPGSSGNPDRTINITSAKWDVYHQEFFPFIGWNRFDAKTKVAKEESTIKISAQNRMVIEAGEVTRFISIEDTVKKLTSNAAPVSAMNEQSIFGNSGKIKIFNNSLVDFVYNPGSGYSLNFKSTSGAIFNPVAGFTVPGKSDLEVSVVRSGSGDKEPVMAFYLNQIESSDPSHADFLGDFPFLTVANTSQIKGYSTQVTIQNKYNLDILIDLTKTKLKTRSGIQFKFMPVTIGSDMIAFPANSSGLYWAERDLSQTNPDLSSDTSITFSFSEKDNSNFYIGSRNAVDIDKDFSNGTTFSQSILADSSITERNMAVFEPTVENLSVVSPNSINDLYESYDYFVDTASSTPLPPSCTPSGGSLPGTCEFKLCRYPISADPTCSTPCSTAGGHDSRYCHVRFLSTSSDVDTQGRAYNFVVKAKGKEVTASSMNSITYTITVSESNSAPVLTFLDGDPTVTNIFNNSTNYKNISSIGATLGTVVTEPYDTRTQSSYSGASNSVNFPGFIEGKTVVAAKDNSFRIFAKSNTKTTTYSSLKAQVSEFYYVDTSGNFVKETSSTDTPSGIPLGIQVGTTNQPSAVALTCITVTGETSNSCQDNLYGSYGYAEIKWVPTDLQTKKYSHANGVIMKVDFCSNCSSGTEPKASVYYKFSVSNKNTSVPAFIATNGSNFVIPDEGANISSGVKNNIINSSDKTEIRVYADSYLKFTVVAEDADGNSPLGSTWATILSLCKNITDENATQTCAFDTWYGTDFSAIQTGAKSAYDGNKFLSDGVTLNDGCRNGDGSLKTDLIVPKVSAASLLSSTGGKRKYQYTLEWCPQRGHLGKFSGSLFIKDFGDLDRQNVREAAVESSTTLKFDVVSRPYFISPRFDYDIGSANPTNLAFQNNHFMRQAYADSSGAFEYHFIVKNTLNNPIVFTVGSPYTSTSGCSVSSTVTSCQMNDGDGNSANDVVVRIDPKNPNVAIMTWSPDATNLSSNINSPKTFWVQVKDTVTNLADNVYFSVIVKSKNAPSALYGASDSFIEVAPKIASIQAEVKDRWNANKVYSQTWDGSNYIYSQPEAQVVEVAEGQNIDFSMVLNSPADQNPYDALFVRWFLDGTIVADNDLSLVSELPTFRYTPDNSAAGSQVAIGSLNLPRGYHHLRAELTDGSLKDSRDWYIKVRNLRPSQDAQIAVDLIPTRQALLPQTITSLVWSQDSLINFTTDTNQVSDYLVVAANYKANSLDRQSIWNIPFVNGVAKLSPQASDPAIYSESLNLNPKSVARLDYLKESGGFKVYLTSESRRLEGYQSSGSNAVVTDLFPRYTSVSPAPCTDLCTQNYYNSGDDVTSFDGVVDRGSSDTLAMKFLVSGSHPIKIFATASSDRRILYLDKGNLDSKTDLSAIVTVPTQLEIRAFTYEPDDKVLYVALSNRDATGPVMTLIKRIKLAKVSENSKGVSETLAQGIDFDIQSDIELKNAAASFDYKINAAALVPGPNLTDTIKNRVVFLSGNIPGGGGALIVINPNDGSYSLKRDASNTLSASATDVPGKGRRLVYSTRDGVLVGLVTVGKQFLIYDPYLQQVTLSSASGYSPTSLLVSPSGLMLSIDRAAGKVFQIK
ncbi:MAG: hypothetical protein B7Y39_10975 [Bdellovibrio sp. 28-41-41]|nr:MAG: hypothetical protein B7Y39_10975 [Bdellovibrio sp. 28-41-41]